MPRIRIHRLVRTEFDEVLAWYADLSSLAAEHFAASFVAALDKIQLRPTAHAPWRTPFRRIRLKRFPYLLIFHAGQRDISVLALVHKQREPTRVLDEMKFRRSEFSD